MFELILELCIEILIWVCGEFLFEGLARAFGFNPPTAPQTARKPLSQDSPESDLASETAVDEFVMEPAQRWMILFIMGVVVGVIVTLFKPESIVRKPIGRFLNLVVSPLVAGAASHGLALILERFNKKPRLFTDFMCGVAFTFGLVVYRYIATT